MTRVIILALQADAYKHGCYNLKCPGFVQISKKFALGAGISPVSKYNGQQFDIILSIRKVILSLSTLAWHISFQFLIIIIIIMIMYVYVTKQKGLRTLILFCV